MALEAEVDDAPPEIAFEACRSCGEWRHMPYAWLREPAVVAPAIAIGLEALLEVQRDAVWYTLAWKPLLLRGLVQWRPLLQSKSGLEAL